MSMGYFHYMGFIGLVVVVFDFMIWGVLIYLFFYKKNN